MTAHVRPAHRCRCGRFTAGFCQACWDRRIQSLRIRVHAALERAGVCDADRCWWWI